MGLNPARVNLDTRVIEVNAPVFYGLTPLQQKLVLAHEEGHVVLNSVDDEIGADKYALEKYVGSEPYSLRKMVDALCTFYDNLPGFPEERKKALIISALEIDVERYGNEHARALLDEIQDEPRVANMAAEAVMTLVLLAIKIAGVIIGLCKTYLWGNRADWFVGDLKGTRENVSKHNLIDAAAKQYVADLVQKHGSSSYKDGGELKIREIILDKDEWVKQVHAYLYPYFKDDNVSTPAFHNKSCEHFYSKCSWAKDYVLSKQEYGVTCLRNIYYEAGWTQDPDAAPKRSGWFWILVAAIVVVAVKQLF